jgi:hypothetical protein
MLGYIFPESDLYPPTCLPRGLGFAHFEAVHLQTRSFASTLIYSKLSVLIMTFAILFLKMQV